MEIRHVIFIKSSPDLKSCPAPGKPEFAFAGRSNVGKSSLINMLTASKKLAKTSSTPGKTQHINHFLVDDAWYLVDLPGYGYARTSKGNRDMFQAAIGDYLLKRSSLACLFLLIDSRHAPLENDLNMLRWLGKNRIPFVLVFTKADKSGGGKLSTRLERYRKILLEEWEEMPQIFVTSSVEHSGREEIMDFIGRTCGQYGR